jgi:hypothetical protein
MLLAVGRCVHASLTINGKPSDELPDPLDIASIDASWGALPRGMWNLQIAHRCSLDIVGIDRRHGPLRTSKFHAASPP